MKKIYIIRHCEAEGQAAETKLTDRGRNQAADLSKFFANKKVDRIISSPYKRAIHSIQPLANQLNIEIEIDGQLTERVLSTKNFPDWFEKLKTTYDDLELKYEGGESSQEAMKRIIEVVEKVFNSENENTVIVTHGNIMSLLLTYYVKDFGFEGWRNLSNPDVFLLRNVDKKVTYERVWG
ncbi:histidine phosphatase family protein [Bacillus sp. FJAT-49682]|uniref:Histidine phosphatase family protein n=1 Tax=Lederbergia citrea TaxID=2833581 RepID=A0A942UPG7_9BACI|nr:histidine phosphatase family protein [Lederbergia citrea]MBS4223142.1 histidine phosphatase family protein [Lederbergia citrea]